MNNVIKSVVFAAVVLVAGIVAMQTIYTNVTGERAANVQPAAGESEGDAFDAARDTFERARDAAEQATETSFEEAEKAFDQASEIVDDAAQATEEAAADAVDATEEAGITPAAGEGDAKEEKAAE